MATPLCQPDNDEWKQRVSKKMGSPITAANAILSCSAPPRLSRQQISALLKVTEIEVQCLSQCHVPRHHLVTARSLWLLRALGTIYRHHFVELIQLILSYANRKHFCLSRLFSLAFLIHSFCILIGALVVFRALTSPQT